VDANLFEPAALRLDAGAQANAPVEQFGCRLR
jgi:hypothetical protein